MSFEDEFHFFFLFLNFIYIAISLGIKDDTNDSPSLGADVAEMDNTHNQHVVSALIN